MKHRIASAFCLLALLAGAAVAPARAADFAFTEPRKDNFDDRPMLLKGVIEDGDLDKLVRLRGDEHIKLVLDSPGGSFAEAIKIARYLRDKETPTEIGANQKCLSACAIAFLGGSMPGPEGLTQVARTMHPTGRLGLHAPYLEMADENYRKDVVEVAYELAMQNIADLIRLSSSLSLDARLLPLVLEKGRKEFYDIDRVDRAGQFKVRIADAARLTRFSPHMLLNYCRNGLAWWANQSQADYMKMIRESSSDPKNNDVSYRDVVAGKEPQIQFQIRKKPKTSGNGYDQFVVALEISHTEPEGIHTAQICTIAINVFAPDQLEIFCTGVYDLEPKGALAKALSLREENDKSFENGKPEYLCYPPEGEFAFLPADTPITEVPGLLDLYRQRMASGRGADAPVNK